MFSVYVGKYDSPKVQKSDLKKLNELGLVGYMFSLGEYYSLKVGTFPHEMNALQLLKALRERGFEAFIERY